MRLSTTLLLMLFAISTAAGCGGEVSTGHTDDKTPGGTPTPPLMDDAAMDNYAAEQAAKTGNSGRTGQ